MVLQITFYYDERFGYAVLKPRAYWINYKARHQPVDLELEPSNLGRFGLYCNNWYELV